MPHSSSSYSKKDYSHSHKKNHHHYYSNKYYYKREHSKDKYYNSKDYYYRKKNRNKRREKHSRSREKSLSSVSTVKMEESNNNFINTNTIINQGNKDNNIKGNINMMKIKAALYLKKVNEINNINNNIFLEDKKKEEKKEEKKEKEKEKDFKDDPLENYLNDIEKDAVFQISDLDKKIITDDDIRIENINNLKENENNDQNENEIEDEKYHKNFLISINKLLNNDNNNNNNKNTNENNDLIYLEDNNEFIKENDLIQPSTEDLWRNLQKKKTQPIELKQIDHSKISYIPITKNLYIESPEITNLSFQDLNNILNSNKIKTHGNNIPRPIINFYQCGFNSIILSIINLKKFTEPLPIQKIAFPVIMSGRDCIGISETGTGKTLAYILPMFRHILNQPKIKEGEGPISIILVPTRELAIQIFKEISYYTNYLKINCACCYGGSSIGNQINSIRRGVEIVVATPGRLIELLSLNNGKLMNLFRCSFVVLDEADRMFDLGFEGQISKILVNIRPDRQIVMFSATFPKSIENIAKKILNKDYIEIIVGNRSSVNENITQEIILIEKKDSLLKLCEILDKNNELSIMIFTENKTECTNLWEKLFKKGYDCVCIEGNMDQEDRYNSLKLFEEKEKKILITTSILSRGLDIPNVELVINFTCPNYMEDYIHRIGRTGRGKNKGKAITFIDKNFDENKVGDIIQALKNSNENVPVELEEIYSDYIKKIENGNSGKFKINGYLGRGYKFDSIEKDKNNIERYLLGFDSNITNNINDNNIINTNKLIKKYNDIKNKEVERNNMSLVLRNQNQELKNKQKLNYIKRDPKLKQICLEVGMNAAKAALISGKKEEEILKMVSIAINNTLNSYKNNSYRKGVENVNKIIEEFEIKDNIKNHIFSIEFNINDYPFNTRLKYTNNTFLNKIKENDNVDVVLKGVFVQPGKTLPPGEKKLCLVIRGKNVNDVNNAYSEIKKNFDEDALDYYTSLSNFTKY